MILDAALLALREIRRNMMRASLTTLGVIIGVAAVIAMVTLGHGATASISKSQSVQLLKLGLNYRLGQASVPWNAGAIAWPGFASSSPGNYNWTGVYVGGQIGGGWGQTGWNSATGEFGSRAKRM